MVLVLGLCIGAACFALGWLIAHHAGARGPRSESTRLERMQDQFITTVSHELRTPLTSINGSLALLSAGLLEAQPEQARQMLQIASRNAERLARLVEDVVAIERLKSGRAALDVRPCRAREIAKRATDDVRERAKSRSVGIELASTLHEDFEFGADPAGLQQVLRHLLDNAVKFSPPSSTIEVIVEATENDVRFVVRDHGPGIAPDQVETIFERFQQVDMSDARRTGGAGLGLAICKGIVEAHGGLIRAQSRGAGTGSTFTVALPR